MLICVYLHSSYFLFSEFRPYPKTDKIRYKSALYLRPGCTDAIFIQPISITIVDRVNDSKIHWLLKAIQKLLWFTLTFMIRTSNKFNKNHQIIHNNQALFDLSTYLEAIQIQDKPFDTHSHFFLRRNYPHINGVTNTHKPLRKH